MKDLPDDLSPMLKHLEACYPNEGCGVVLRGGSGFRIVPLDNAYDRYHAKDPVQFPRTARTAYRFDPKQWLHVSEDADSKGEQVSCIFHSHADVGAYFSGEDRAMAAPEGEPLLPEVCYVVVAIDQGRATAVRKYVWENGDFTERTLFDTAANR